MPDMSAYDMDNIPPQPSDDDETGVWFDYQIDDYEDEYDRCEDAYLESGYDPYRLFSEDKNRRSAKALKYALKRIVQRLRHSFLMRVSADYRARMDDIPF